jgi:hypothetical protein
VVSAGDQRVIEAASAFGVRIEEKSSKADALTLDPGGR